jgi:uncharacterized protein YceK
MFQVMTMFQLGGFSSVYTITQPDPQYAASESGTRVRTVEMTIGQCKWGKEPDGRFLSTRVDSLAPIYSAASNQLDQSESAT